MTTVAEYSKTIEEDNASKERKRVIAEAKPTLDMFQHIGATQATTMGFTITLLDGTSHKAASADFFFSDGLSVVENEHRIYIPKTAIRSIVIHNPGDKAN